MKNTSSLIFLLILLNSVSFSQSPAPDIQWKTALGGSSSDHAQCIQQTPDRGYIVAGNTYSNNGDVSGNHGLMDVWITKLDSMGKLEWQKTLGGSQNDEAYSIRNTPDGGYIVGGYTSSNDMQVSGNHGTPDFWIVKLDNAGNVQWQKCLGGSGTDYPGYYDGSLSCTSDGGYIVAGTATSNDGQVSGNHGNADYWVVKLDGTGNIQWQKSLGGSEADQASSIQQTSDGGYVVAGYSQSNDGDVTGNHSPAGTFFRDFWIVKLDNAGNLIWQKALGGSDNEEAYAIQQTPDKGYIITGKAESNDGDVTGHHAWADSWIVKLDSMGSLDWQKCYGGTADEYAQSVQLTPDGGYIVASSSNSGSGDGDITTNDGSLDYWIQKLDSTGNMQWQKSLGGSNMDEAYSIIVTFDSGYVIAGSSRSVDGDVHSIHGSNSDDVWIVKLHKAFASPVNIVIIVPNLITPNGDQQNDAFIIKNLPDGYALEICNRWGSLIYKNKQYSNTNAWNGNEASDGIYYFHLSHKSLPEYKGWLHLIR
ncbi:MAG: gliding motility-associated C-terminal domain-containing protein [Cytophagaceae bacterium]